MATKTRSTGGTKLRSRTSRAVPKKVKTHKKVSGYTKAYDAKKYGGSVPAFASVTAEEMKAWRDDRLNAGVPAGPGMGGF